MAKNKSYKIGTYKLTQAQAELLWCAWRTANHDGWRRCFIPTKYELTDIYGTKSSAKALCGLGLLEYKVLWHGRRNEPDVLEFRITDAGTDIASRLPPTL